MKKSINNIKLKPFRALAVLLAIFGLALSVSMYISTIWLESFICNSQTQNIGHWIQNNMSFIFVVVGNPPLLDSLLFLGLVLALTGTFFVYREKKGNIYALEKTLYIYSVLIAILVFISVDVMQWLATSFFGVIVAPNGYPTWNYGFPTWTFMATTVTSFWKYPSYTQDNPNVYFLNLWQLFSICVCIAVITKLLMKRQEKANTIGKANTNPLPIS
jgi:hypothetical protein